MRRCIPFFIVTLLAGLMMIPLAPPTYAGDEGDYADIADEYYDDVAPPPPYRGEGRYERPYLAYTFAPKLKRDYVEEKVDYRPPYGAYAYGPRYHKPRHRKACVFGPIREKKVCDYEPRHCWKERECYFINGKRYCRHYTKCKGGDKRCYWVKKRGYGGPSCGGRY